MMRLWLALAVSLFAVIESAGCTEAPAPEPVGYIDIPLTAPGAGGAIYRLPPGTALVLSNSTFGGDFSLDGDVPSLTVKVPPGDYSVVLVDSAGDTTTWPLQRQNADGTTETVPATLDLTPTISVVEDQTTPLVIRFHLGGVFPITFARGSLAVSVEVDEASSSSLDIELSASALAVQSVDVGDTAPADLPSRLPALGDTGDRYVATMQTVGSWVATSPGTVCIQVAASVDAGGNQGFTNLVAEAPPSGNEQLCIVQVLPQFAFLTTSFLRQGDATTPLLSDLGSHEFIVSHGINATINADIYDGTTLHLDALSGVQPAGMLIFGAVFSGVDTPVGTIFESWYQLNEFGDGTLTLRPH